MLYLFIISGCYPKILWLLWQLSWTCSSLAAVILRFFGFSGSHNSSSSLAVTVSCFWLLWLLSPFLHVITGGDHTPIQKGATQSQALGIQLRVTLTLPTLERLNQSLAHARSFLNFHLTWPPPMNWGQSSEHFRTSHFSSLKGSLLLLSKFQYVNSLQDQIYDPRSPFDRWLWSNRNIACWVFGCEPNLTLPTPDIQNTPC